MQTREERLKSRHWIIVELFELAIEMELQSPNWEPFSERILEMTGERIPPGSMKYWFNGYSTPKLNEVDLMALSLGYEIDIMRLKEGE